MVYRTGKQYASEAKNPKYDKITYDTLDCQGFVERVLSDLGIRRDDGSSYNWRGSNHIARTACSWVGTKEDAIAKFGSIPLGAWAFKWDDKGGEVSRGYTDGMGDYKHIGIYVGDDIVRDSTRTSKRDGVGQSTIDKYNRIGLCKYLDFGYQEHYNNYDAIVKTLDSIRQLLNDLEGMVNG